VRYLGFIIAGFFAGIGGALAAINFEIVNASDSLSSGRSGAYLLFTFLGGATFFFGPMIGAVLLVFASVLLSELTKAWLLYLGLIFLFMVMYAPGGIASLIMMNVRVAAHRKLHRLWGWYAALAATALVMLAGLAALIELVYHLQLESGSGSTLRYFGLTLDTQSAASWLGAFVVAVLGAAAFELVRHRFGAEWGRVQAEIESTMAFKEPGAAAPEGGAAAAREASLGTP
jgi:branched-chain amino acid transport system permease protein